MPDIGPLSVPRNFGGELSGVFSARKSGAALRPPATKNPELGRATLHAKFRANADQTNGC
jgi:hypothetical protein